MTSTVDGTTEVISSTQTLETRKRPRGMLSRPSLAASIADWDQKEEIEEEHEEAKEGEQHRGNEDSPTNGCGGASAGTTTGDEVEFKKRRLQQVCPFVHSLHNLLGHNEVLVATPDA